MTNKEFEAKLRALCIAHDNEYASYPEHEFEGMSVFEFFIENGIDDGAEPDNENLKHEWDVSDRWRSGGFPTADE